MRNLPEHAAASVARHIWHMPRRAVSTLITAYQHTLSPDHGLLRHLWSYGYCRHEPTCSEYAKQQIQARGLLLGLLYGAIRILSCHPWKKVSDEKILKTLHRTQEKK